MTTKFPSQEELKEMRAKLDKGPASKPLPPHASAVDKTKHKICSLFIVYKREHNLTQVKIAKRLGVDESVMSKILHYHIDDFTTDRLIRYLTIIYPEVEVKVEVA